MFFCYQIFRYNERKMSLIIVYYFFIFKKLFNYFIMFIDICVFYEWKYISYFGLYFVFKCWINDVDSSFFFIV